MADENVKRIRNKSSKRVVPEDIDGEVEEGDDENRQWKVIKSKESRSANNDVEEDGSERVDPKDVEEEEPEFVDLYEGTRGTREYHRAVKAFDPNSDELQDAELYTFRDREFESYGHF